MPITVTKAEDDLYFVSASPPDADEEWSPSQPLTGHQVTRGLQERGCHQQDISDAMSEADPKWIEKLRGPFIPPSIDR